VGISSETEAVHLQNVMRHAHHRPFRSHLLDPPQEKLPEASCMFDLSEYGFDDPLSPRIDRRAGFRLKLASHAIDPVRPVRQWPTGLVSGLEYLVFRSVSSASCSRKGGTSGKCDFEWRKLNFPGLTPIFRFLRRPLQRLVSANSIQSPFCR
jgi:hypothetical protein